MPDSSKSLLSPYLSLSARLLVSAIVSLVTAVLVYLSLPCLMVRPMRRLTESMMAFRLTLSQPTARRTRALRNASSSPHPAE